MTHHFAPGPSHLERYSQVFNACEINSSFYRPHRIDTWRRWRDAVPIDFRFSVKAPKSITHEALLDCKVDVLRAFFQQIENLQDKLGPVLFQLPPRLEFTAARAKGFLRMVRDSYSGDVVLEPRHASWFADEVNEFLQEFDITRAAADPSCVPGAAMPGGRTTLAYFRLHGSPRPYYSEYSEDFLNTLATQVAQLARSAQVWCVFDNTALGHATANARTIREKIIALTKSNDD